MAHARLQVAKESTVAIEGLYSSASAKYQSLFNHLPQLSQMNGVDAPTAHIPKSLHAALTIARKQHPALKAAQMRIDIAQNRKAAAYSDFLPKVDFLASALRENDIDGAAGTEHTYGAQIRFRVNLYAGGLSTARDDAAKIRISESRASLAGISRRVDEETHVAWREYETTGQRRDLLEEAVKIATQVYEARKKMRDAGRETAINVLNAESELFQTQIKYVGADFAYRVAGFRLLRAMGRLRAKTLGLASK